MAIQKLPSLPSNKDIRAVLKKYRLKEKVYIIFIGALRYYKNISLLLEAAPYINADILIVGDGPSKLTYQEIITNQNIENVHLLGSVSEKDKNSLLSLSSLLVLPSHLRSEAFGMVLAEGLATGMQVVSTNSFSGPAEVLGNGRYGFLADVDNVSSIVSSMRAAINSPISREIIHEGASRFSVDVITNKYLEFISAVIESEGNIYDPI